MPFTPQELESLSEISKRISDNVAIVEDPPILDNSNRSVKALEAIQESMEHDRQERIQAEKSAKRWQIVNLIVGVLTLIATIVFGLLTILSSPQ